MTTETPQPVPPPFADVRAVGPCSYDDFCFASPEEAVKMEAANKYIGYLRDVAARGDFRYMAFAVFLLFDEKTWLAEVVMTPGHLKEYRDRTLKPGAGTTFGEMTYNRFRSIPTADSLLNVRALLSVPANDDRTVVGIIPIEMMEPAFPAVGEELWWDTPGQSKRVEFAGDADESGLATVAKVKDGRGDLLLAPYKQLFRPDNSPVQPVPKAKMKFPTIFTQPKSQRWSSAAPNLSATPTLRQSTPTYTKEQLKALRGACCAEDDGDDSSTLRDAAAKLIEEKGRVAFIRPDGPDRTAVEVYANYGSVEYFSVDAVIDARGPSLEDVAFTLRQTLDALKAHEQWEADVNLNDDSWRTDPPVIQQEQLDSLPEVQRKRNLAVRAAEGMLKILAGG